MLIKKVSDMADSDASSSFKEELTKMNEKTADALAIILDMLK